MIDASRFWLDRNVGRVLSVDAGGMFAEADNEKYIWLGWPTQTRFIGELARLRLWVRLGS